MALQAPLSMGISQKDYWSGLPFPTGDLPNPGIELVSLMSPALAEKIFTISTTWEVCNTDYPVVNILNNRGIFTLPTEVHLVKAMVFPMVVYGCESWTVKKAES